MEATDEKRYDDASEEVIEKRIKTYEAETKPILDYYDQDKVTVIDGTQPPVKVLHDLIGRVVQSRIYQEMARIKV